MTSVAEKRRRKKAAKITLPGGAEIPQRAKQGRRTDLEARHAPETAITARLRIAGMDDTPDNRRAASDARHRTMDQLLARQAESCGVIVQPHLPVA